MIRQTRNRLAAEDGKINRSLWLVVILVAILGMALIDGAALLYARIQMEQVANDAATEAASVVGRDGSFEAASEAAQSIVKKSQGMVFDEEQFDIDDGTVTVVIKKHVGTIFITHIPPIKTWADLEVTTEAKPSSNL